MRLHGVGCLAAAWLLSLAQAEGDPPSSQGKLPDSASAFKLQPGDVDMYPYAYHEATDFNTAACGGKVPVIFSLNGIDSFRHGDEEVLNKVGVQYRRCSRCTLLDKDDELTEVIHTIDRTNRSGKDHSRFCTGFTSGAI